MGIIPILSAVKLIISSMNRSSPRITLSGSAKRKANASALTHGVLRTLRLLIVAPGLSPSLASSKPVVTVASISRPRFRVCRPAGAIPGSP